MERTSFDLCYIKSLKIRLLLLHIYKSLKIINWRFRPLLALTSPAWSPRSLCFADLERRTSDRKARENRLTTIFRNFVFARVTIQRFRSVHLAGGMVRAFMAMRVKNPIRHRGERPRDEFSTSETVTCYASVPNR